MAESKILNIKKLKIVCKNCKTEVITDIGKNIANCPCCYAAFGATLRDNPYQILADAFATLSQNIAADFSLICEDEL